MVSTTPYVNAQLWQESYSQAEPPTNIWQMIKFAGAILERTYSTQPTRIAEWDSVGRGAAMPAMQSASIIAGNVSQAAKGDRYGPFRDPRLSQAVIEAYLAQALPSQATQLEAATQVGGSLATLGYGAPGG